MKLIKIHHHHPSPKTKWEGGWHLNMMPSTCTCRTQVCFKGCLCPLVCTMHTAPAEGRTGKKGTGRQVENRAKMAQSPQNFYNHEKRSNFQKVLERANLRYNLGKALHKSITVSNDHFAKNFCIKRCPWYIYLKLPL